MKSAITYRFRAFLALLFVLSLAMGIDACSSDSEPADTPAPSPSVSPTPIPAIPSPTPGDACIEADPEVCDGRDNDCDGSIDEDFLTTVYEDEDGDGFGDSSKAVSATSCAVPVGTTARDGDCDDKSDRIYPAAFDITDDGIDQDCGGTGKPQPSVGLSTSSYRTVQAAIDAARDGETVWVGPGTYPEHSLTMRGKAITLRSTDGAGATVLDGQGQGSVFLFDSSEGAGSVVWGLTLTGGHASEGGGMYLDGSSPTLTQVTFSGNATYYGDGAGMYLSGSSPTLTQVTFSGNAAYDGDGGGMYLSGSSPTLTQVTFTGNEADDGGGMYLVSSNPTLDNGTFSGNDAGRYGGGMYLVSSNPTVSRVTFSGNHSHYSCGGMYLDGSSPKLAQVTFTDNYTKNGVGGGMELHSSNPTLTEVTFAENFGYNGGGMYLELSSPALDHVTFSGNESCGGGGMYLDGSSPTLSHVTFSANTATNNPWDEGSDFFGRGGGMWLVGSSPTLNQVILTGNQAEIAGGGIYLKLSSSTPVLENTILAYNTGYNLYSDSAQPGLPALTYCVLYAPPGESNHNLSSLDSTNLTVEPGFLTYTDGQPTNFHLAKTSPLVNAGDPALLDPDGSRSDLGIYCGPDADGWDRDGDGWFDYFWPGTIQNAPAGFSPADFDAADGDATVH